MALKISQDWTIKALRLLIHLLLFLLTFVDQVAATKPLIARWYNKYVNGAKGYAHTRANHSDGLWNTLAISLGEKQMKISIPMWPSAYDVSFIPSGAWNFRDSPSASEESEDVGWEINDPWLSKNFTNQSLSIGDSWQEALWFTDEDSGFRTTMLEFKEWTSSSKPEGTQVGILGLGRKSSDDSSPPSLLTELSETSMISSNSWSMHLGSDSLGIPGSLVLGGYDANRALGDVGVFSLDEDSGIPSVPLIDLILDVAVGQPSFERGSIWNDQAEDSTSNQSTTNQGDKSEYLLVIPNPASPYIYLPGDKCEAAAKRLPIKLDEELGLYVWEPDSVDVDDFTREYAALSSAYMAFVFSDQNTRSITIRIPLRLLILYLDPPMSDSQKKYFPCKPDKGRMGKWQLGRAFLQGSFFGINYDTNVTYLAEAPGQYLSEKETSVKEFDRTSTTIHEQLTVFGMTWEETWNFTPTPIDNYGDYEQSDYEQSEGMKGGPIAGIVVGSVAVAGAMSGLAFFIWRRRRRAAQRRSELPAEAPSQDKKEPAGLNELHEAPTGTEYQELDVPAVIHEAPGDEVQR